MRQSRVLLSTIVAAALGATVLTSGPGAAAKSSSPRQAGKPYTVTAKADRTELVLGQKVTISGTVAPTAAGKSVLLQQKIGDNPWRDQTTATIKKSGRTRSPTSPRR